ncbi:MAG: ROK family protein [Verrucomicrobia bacterium]|jgi:glucokinase|nr:ROK family protein [Verrucomicrobiota bacterium]|tara:strand:- start:40029 stop:40970 length:942 start_codon:yes stop_codon:yes gene_type:complete
MNDIPLAIGIDFGGTSVKIGAVRGSEIIDRAPPIATQDFNNPEELIAAMVRAVEDLRSRHEGIIAIGIGMPGFVNFEKGIVFNLTNVRGWENIPLRDLLSKATGLPVAADNDANCMAFAEWKLGAGKGYNHLVCASLGTGVGGGIIMNGSMARGARFGAGEIGQTSIDYQGRRGHYGNLGALEDYIGNQEITRDALVAYQAAGISKDIEDCSPAALSEAARHGDAIAIERWNLIGRMLATSLMNACWLLNPEALVIGGGVARAGNLVFNPVREHLLKQLSGPFKHGLAILPAAFGHEAGTIGAAALALEAAKI